MSRIYLDYAATTPVDPRVLKAMGPFFTDKFGNTMSLHAKGGEASKAVEEAREFLLKSIEGETSDQLIFTASATESNNLAIKGIMRANRHKGNHLIISAIEHDCVLESARSLIREGYELTILPVDKEGFVAISDLEQAIGPKTILVSVIHGNNEIGTIQNLAAIGEVCHSKKILFHTDASQTFGKLKINVIKENVDLLTASSQKIYGPKGAAFLYVKKNILLEPILHGGGHENGLRSSTLNVPAIVGFAAAAKIYEQERTVENERISALRDLLIYNLIRLPDVLLNGPVGKQRLPNNVSLSFGKVEGESLLMRLDMAGIEVSTGSACSSKNLEASHVLLAIGLPHERAHGTIRFSLGRMTTEQEIQKVIEKVPKIVNALRRISPFKS